MRARPPANRISASRSREKRSGACPPVRDVALRLSDTISRDSRSLGRRSARSGRPWSSSRGERSRDIQGSSSVSDGEGKGNWPWSTCRSTWESFFAGILQEELALERIDGGKDVDKQNGTPQEKRCAVAVKQDVPVGN